MEIEEKVQMNEELATTDSYENGWVAGAATVFVGALALFGFCIRTMIKR